MRRLTRLPSFVLSRFSKLPSSHHSLIYPLTLFSWTCIRATMARVGREKLRMACARYLSIWYRDRFRTGSAGAAATAAEAAELRRRVQDGRVTFVSNNPELEQEIEDQQKALVALQAKLADALRQREADAKRATDAEKALHDRDGYDPNPLRLRFDGHAWKRSVSRVCSPTLFPPSSRRLLIKQQADLDRAKVALQQAEDQLSRGLNASDLLGNGMALPDCAVATDFRASCQTFHSISSSYRLMQPRDLRRKMGSSARRRSSCCTRRWTRSTGTTPARATTRRSSLISTRGVRTGRASSVCSARSHPSSHLTASCKRPSTPPSPRPSPHPPPPAQTTAASPSRM